MNFFKHMLRLKRIFFNEDDTFSKTDPTEGESSSWGTGTMSQELQTPLDSPLLDTCNTSIGPSPEHMTFPPEHRGMAVIHQSRNSFCPSNGCPNHEYDGLPAVRPQHLRTTSLCYRDTGAHSEMSMSPGRTSSSLTARHSAVLGGCKPAAGSRRHRSGQASPTPYFITSSTFHTVHAASADSGQCSPMPVHVKVRRHTSHLHDSARPSSLMGMTTDPEPSHHRGYIYRAHRQIPTTSPMERRSTISMDHVHHPSPRPQRQHRHRLHTDSDPSSKLMSQSFTSHYNSHATSTEDRSEVYFRSSKVFTPSSAVPGQKLRHLQQRNSSAAASTGNLHHNGNGKGSNSYSNLSNSTAQSSTSTLLQSPSELGAFQDHQHNCSPYNSPRRGAPSNECQAQVVSVSHRQSYRSPAVEKRQQPHTHLYEKRSRPESSSSAFKPIPNRERSERTTSVVSWTIFQLSKEILQWSLRLDGQLSVDRSMTTAQEAESHEDSEKKQQLAEDRQTNYHHLSTALNNMLHARDKLQSISQSLLPHPKASVRNPVDICEVYQERRRIHQELTGFRPIGARSASYSSDSDNFSSS